MLKTLRIKGPVKEANIRNFLIYCIRGFFPSLEYCSLHTVMPAGKIDVQNAIKEALADKHNKKEILKWQNSS